MLGNASFLLFCQLMDQQQWWFWTYLLHDGPAKFRQETADAIGMSVVALADFLFQVLEEFVHRRTILRVVTERTVEEKGSSFALRQI